MRYLHWLLSQQGENQRHIDLVATFEGGMTKTATLQQALTRFLDPAGLDRQRQWVCTHLLATKER